MVKLSNRLSRKLNMLQNKLKLSFGSYESYIFVTWNTPKQEQFFHNALQLTEKEGYQKG
jgi:hypothetical protein